MDNANSLRRDESNSEDSGGILRPLGQKLLPRTATITRAHVSINDCIEQPEYQKRRTQFLASNYVGETAIIPGPWSSVATSEILDESGAEQVMFLADPKLSPQQELRRTGDLKKSEKGEDDSKSLVSCKGVAGDSDEDGDGYKRDSSVRNNYRK